MEQAAFRLFLVTFNALLYLSIPIRSEPYDTVFAQAHDEQSDNLTCAHIVSGGSDASSVLHTYPQALQTQVRLCVKREGDAKRQGEHVVRHQVEQRTEMLSTWKSHLENFFDS